MSYWQLRCAEMKQRSAYLYQSGLWSDCSFKLGEEEVIVKAHKLIMAMASPVFGKLFYGREAVKSPVPIHDTRPEVFRILLEYIYSDHINLTNLRDACDLHNAAFKWRLPYVKEMCIKFISSSLNADNVICIYELACKSKELHLQDDCIEIFKTLTKDILKAESFKEAKLSTVLKIFSMDTLNIDSELDLFKAAVNHATAQEAEDEGLKRTLDPSEDCFAPGDGPSSAKRSRIDSTGLDSAVEIETNNVTTSDTPAVNASAESSRNESQYKAEHDYVGESPRENDMPTESTDYEDKLLKAKIKATRREKYRDLMRKIRFLTLTPQEFAECTTLSKLLSSSAMLALSLNISAKDTFVPMPKHFSTSMVPRNLSQQNERENRAGTTRITVNNIRNLKKFESNPFYIRNLAWTLMLLHLQETDEDVDTDILIIAVTCFFEKGVPEWIGNVEVRVSFISENDINDQFQDMKLKLSQPCNDYAAWIIKTEWSELMTTYGIIEDNTVTCKVYVSTNILKSPTSPDSSPDDTQTDYITTPLRSSTPVSRARYLKEKSQKRSDLTASRLAETRCQTPLLPEKRSLTPLLPEKRSLTPLLPETRSLTPLLPEKRSPTPLSPEKGSLTPLMSEKCSVPSPLIEKRSLTPLLPEKRSVTPSQHTEKSSLTPVLTDKRLPPVLSEKSSGSPLIEKHGAKTPLKRNLSPLPKERNITPPPVENRSLPPRPKKRYITQSPTEKLAGSPDKSSLTSSSPETSNRPVKNRANSSPLPPNNNATPSLPEKHVLRPTSLPINTKTPLSSRATLTQSIPAPMSSPLLSGEVMRPKQTGNNTVCSPQTLKSPVVGPINLNSSDPAIETLNLSVRSKDKPRALACVQILRSLHRKGYPINGSVAQKYLNELSAMSINGFQVLRPLLAYANASAATNGSGHIVPAIMDKKRDVVSPINSTNSASRFIDNNNTKSETKPDQKENEPSISVPIPRKDNVSSVSESMAITDDNSAISNPSDLTDCTDSVNEQNIKQLSPTPLALKDDGPSTSEPFPIKDNVSSVSEPMVITEDITAISNPSAVADSTDSISDNTKRLLPKPLALNDDGSSISEPNPKKDTGSFVSEPMVIPDDITAISIPSALSDCTDSINENKQQLDLKSLALKDDGPSISEPMPMKDTVSSVSETTLTDDVKVISDPLALIDVTDSIKAKDMKQQEPKSLLNDNEPSISEQIPIKDNVSSISEPMPLIDDNKAICRPSARTDFTDSINETTKQLVPKPLAPKYDGPSIEESIPMKDTGSSVSEPMTLTGDIEVISSPSAPVDCTYSINEQNMKQLAPKSLALEDDGPSISEPIPKKDTVTSISETMALTDDIEVISNTSVIMDGADSIKEKDMTQLAPKPLAEPVPKKDTGSSALEPMAITDNISSAHADFSDSINEDNMEQQEPIRIRDTSYSVLEPMAITDDITGIPSQDFTDSSIEQNIKQLAFIPHAPNDNELSISEPIPIKDSSAIKPLTTTDDINSAFKSSIIAASSVLDPLPLSSLALLHSNVSLDETSIEQVHPESPVPVISEPIHLNDDVSLSGPMVLKDDTSVAVSADEKNKEQPVPYPLPLKHNEPLILEPMCLKEAGDTNSVSELSSINNAPNVPNQMSEKSEAELTTMDRTNTVLEQTDDEKNKEQTTLKTLALQAIIPFVSDPNLKENISMVPQSLYSSVDDESVLKLTASNNNSSSTSDSTSLKYDDSETSELIDVIDNADSNLKRDSIENPLNVIKDDASSNNKSLADDKTSPTPIDLMKSVDTHPEPHNIKCQLTLGNTELLKSEPLDLNDTFLLESKPVAVPLVLNDNLSSKSKPMDLMDIFDMISELHTLEARLTFGDTKPSKSEPLSLNNTILLDSKPVEVPLVLNNNLSSASKPMNTMERVSVSVSDTMALDDIMPLMSTPLALNENISDQIESDSKNPKKNVEDPLAQCETETVALVSLDVNENISSEPKPIDLMENADTNVKSHSVESRLILGDTESSKS